MRAGKLWDVRGGHGCVHASTAVWRKATHGGSPGFTGFARVHGPGEREAEGQPPSSKGSRCPEKSLPHEISYKSFSWPGPVRDDFRSLATEVSRMLIAPRTELGEARRAAQGPAAAGENSEKLNAAGNTGPRSRP